ncbi:hypothetical protein K438DRAFT_1890520 [Mycena galopus ATCC 62051]|nr:hypothetical protein K438DRAFT_1890520 [Mycena galopus ATCC 62051]
MPPDIPPELFNRIVCDLDTRSLKACAQTGSVLCAASQPILFRTFTLSDGPVSHVDWSTPSFAAALEHLDESPHIARYITHLKVQLLGYTNPTAPHNLQRVLARLPNVHRFTIVGNSDRYGYLIPGFSSVVADFVSRRHLDTLRVESLRDVPLSLILRFLTAPRALSLMAVSVQSVHGLNPQTPPHVSTVNTLVLDTGTNLDDILVSPTLTSCLADLRHLSIVAHKKTSRVISCVALTLFTLRIRFLGAFETTASIRFDFQAQMPALRSVEFSLDHWAVSNWLPATISFLRPNISPVLGEIIIGYWPVPRTPCREDLAAVDAALAAHPASPRITWRPRFFVDQGDDVVEHEAFVKEGMPWAGENLRLFVEAEIYDSGVVPGQFWAEV